MQLWFNREHNVQPAAQETPCNVVVLSDAFYRELAGHPIPEQVVEVTGVRTRRAMVFYVRDPGAGFRRESLTPAAIANPAVDAAAHIEQREAEGIRPGGYGLLLAAGTVDELIYSEVGNEVLLVKYVDPTLGSQ